MQNSRKVCFAGQARGFLVRHQLALTVVQLAAMTFSPPSRKDGVQNTASCETCNPVRQFT